MLLHFREMGQGAPLVILHGLFGFSDNWQTLARRWAEAGHRVIVADLRNHGRSFHSAEHSYELMSQDILGLFDHLQLDGATTTLLGHSMGGKASMRFALDYPDRLARLVVVDIAPRASTMHHQDDILTGLNAVPVATLESRQQAEEALAQHVPQPGVRQFLLKNLYRQEDNTFAWRQNLAALTEHMEDLGAEISSDKPFLKPALFIRGGKSDYITTEDKLYGIPAIFPNSQVETVVNAGHWVHAEAPDAVFSLVQAFATQG
ncbi:Pimeloyl-ACP methyl ester carboxylesterase [Hymenobacter gelipurpurascens]|uniref:Pimeloyl-ACP methyl ester carboxylesterase n=1 Tax=Hymenobacter gelipurpurascens TaxID=89968 RepID=A0A212UGP6_9BACT|nr:alpha/beta fold hydrolase [Hymenobacter gelipurpurascens]SNC77415.1 Pimeloyl-ACP methyl ester carboxylesterase [Hymenobacter gelipurpurascens]